jgi:hypothetical protein
MGMVLTIRNLRLLDDGKGRGDLQVDDQQELVLDLEKSRRGFR